MIKKIPKKLLYMDYNSTTPVLPRVSNKISEHLLNNFGNPSNSHLWGQKAFKALQNSRRQVSNLINSSPSEVYFTSCATESNNLAIFGSLNDKSDHIITVETEHVAILKPLAHLQNQGYKVTYLPVDSNGLIDIQDLEKSIRPTTKLISIMAANNETGVLQPIQQIGEISKKHKILFHTDAAQAVGKISLDVQKIHADLVTIAGHKFYAPKGVGALFVKNGVNIKNLFFGGDQEQGIKSGTENIPYIVGLGEACQLSLDEDYIEEGFRQEKLRYKLVEGLKSLRKEFIVHGAEADRLPNTCSVGFKGYMAGDIIEMLNLMNVGVSAGAACHGEVGVLSQVLKSMNVQEIYGLGTIRFSLGRLTQSEDIDDLVSRLSICFEEIDKNKL